jgi:hypothetical protein
MAVDEENKGDMAVEEGNEAVEEMAEEQEEETMPKAGSAGGAVLRRLSKDVGVGRNEFPLVYGVRLGLEAYGDPSEKILALNKPESVFVHIGLDTQYGIELTARCEGENHQKCRDVTPDMLFPEKFRQDAEIVFGTERVNSFGQGIMIAHMTRTRKLSNKEVFQTVVKHIRALLTLFSGPGDDLRYF